MNKVEGRGSDLEKVFDRFTISVEACECVHGDEERLCVGCGLEDAIQGSVDGGVDRLGMSELEIERNRMREAKKEEGGNEWRTRMIDENKSLLRFLMDVDLLLFSLSERTKSLES